MEGRVIALLVAFNLAGVAGAETLYLLADKRIVSIELDVDGRLGPPNSLMQEGALGRFLVMHPSLPALYVEWRNGRSTGVAALRIEEDGTLSKISHSAIELNGGVVHLGVNGEGSVLSVASYGGRTVGAFALNEDGSIGEQLFRAQHEGASVHPQRQRRAHPHGAIIDRDGGRIHFTDLGTDELWTYERMGEGYRLAGRFAMPAGSGPRHAVFNATQDIAYVTEELSAGVSVLSYHQSIGEFSLLQRASTVGEGELETPNKVSHIELHPNGKYAYAGNRGHDSIAVFAVDVESGRLSPIEREATRGSFPRYFEVSPSGRWLVAANTRTRNLAVFAIEDDGSLQFTLNTMTLGDVGSVAIVE